MRQLPFVARKHSFVWALLAFTFLAQSAHAHRPVFTDDSATSADTAIAIKDAKISQVVYREIGKESPQVWLSFSAPEDLKLFVQIGVPFIDSLKDFRPAMVLVGPGLPDKNVPFEIAKNTGFMVLTTEKVAKPRFFHEHFTNTDSWILRGETVSLPKPGRYYLVAYSPEKKVGKLWLSIGKKESFSMEDWKEFPKWRKKIRAFHEVKGE